MRNSIIALLLLVNIGTANAQTDSFLTDIEKKWENARTYTLKVAESMPESAYNFKPTEEEMTFAEQLAHLSGNMLWLSSKFITANTPAISEKNFTGKSKAEMIQLINQAFEFTANAFKNFNPDQLNDKIDFAGQKITKRQIILLIHDHLTHHRGQIIVYTRLKGVKPPKYIGW